MQSLELEERIPKSSNCLSLWIRSTPKSRDSENTYFPLEELHEELKEKGTTSDVGSCRRRCD
ncbi:hypothetical protein Ahy_B02g060572 isoform D [Arachis hypogaea]|uniref:Uncharacterized protein n=1 Tax=Arachis hypogaea TaxID=3818 RepID=A0A445AIT1_ARAHY|nr:hypothetical protein Ahy_B02g060572 isoform D [Arachis hypogaea]